MIVLDLNTIRKAIFLLLFIFCFSFYSTLNAQKTINKIAVNTDVIRIDWQDIQTIKPAEDLKIKVLKFKDCIYSRNFQALPNLIERKQCFGNENLTAIIEPVEVTTVNNEELSIIEGYTESLPTEFYSESSISKSREGKYSFVTIYPIRKDKNTGNYEKLISYRIIWKEQALKTIPPISKPSGFSNSSVLATGTWYKIAIGSTGIYKIDKAFLTNLGIDVSSVNPINIKIFGNGGRILPEKNISPRYDDLNEIAISVSGESDGVFDNNDYILFYGKGPQEWDYNPGTGLTFNYVKNYYSDSSYYFITTDNGAGKRIQTQASSPLPYNYTSSSFDDYAVHEIDAANLVKSGREMYGESFDILTNYSMNFSFPFLTSNDTVHLKTSIAGRTFSGTADFRVSYPSGNYIISCPYTGSTYLDDIAREISGVQKYNNISSNSISISIDKITSSATGWLNYVWINVRRDLIMSGSQMAFRDTRNISGSNITRFTLSTSATPVIWDVSDPFNVAEQLTTANGSGLEFILPTPTLKEFVSHTGSGYYTPTKIGEIPNQNLHAVQPVDYIIITNPAFKQQAQKLANLHSQYDTLSYVIATTDEIYNEFSSGAQDITAIRDFARMLYKRATASNLPKYLLLLGDGSYDNIHRYSLSNTDYIPTYQTYNSLSYTGSYGSDDFYAMMDDAEGDLNSGDLVDIGVGRLPVHSQNEADNVVNKIIQYYKKDPNFNPYANNTSCTNNNESNFGDWRNWICFIADDANDSWETTFVHGSENFVNFVVAADKNYNIDKIYLDAYKQESTPGGERYPDVNEAINKRIEKGALIINYSGHGGETGLAHEDVVDIPQILNWKNINNLPMFLTATCEFSRYDDPARTSAGEEILLNPVGGGIALLTTTRVAYSSDGDALCPKFFSTALVPLGNKMPALGDIIRITKFKAGAAYRHFTLLGDPGVLLAYPKESVTTSQINFNPIGVNDTIKALQKVTITGFVSDRSGAKLTNYNGVIYPTVFDKTVKSATLGNDLGPSEIINFYLQKNVLYKGKSLVTNGDFSFSFIVPYDIAYLYGFGRISYYAQNGDIDASGYYDKVIIGGSYPNAKIDVLGPEAKLFMNDNKFVYGGTTNENPQLYAEVFDSSGINTVGNAIGHDLAAVLDANSSKKIVLNDYYQSDLNSFQSGKIRYPFNELSEGTHNLSIKVWDIQNNSSNAYTEFVVAASAELALKHVLNYPNPFTTNTKFFIEHNQCCVGLNVEIQVFTISGKIVKTINKSVTNEGYRTEGIDWDGKDDFGDKIGQGVYVYRVKMKTSDGKTSEKFEKLVILN